MDFINYLTGLAQENETLLFVRQKPLRDANGDYEYHKDGAVKCVWPAVYPHQRRKQGEAWYINTAIFIKDRLDPDRPSAAAANAEFVAFMVLDDIGTKSKKPELPPTWIIETSPDNYQWGYVYREQPRKNMHAAALKAIAEAGYTDPGAINPVRNVRIPGSINIKPGRDNFESKLIEFNPENEYTLDEICTAFDVTPAEPDTTRPISFNIKDDGNDDVVAWLNSNNLILSRPNSSGWLGVVCPNSKEHSDGNPEARYHPATRSFCCYHGHCDHINSDIFLHWVAENGGPEHKTGIRDDLLASVMKEAQEKIELHREGDNMFSENSAAAAAIREVENRALDRFEKETLHDHYAYVLSDDAYFNLDLRTELKRRSFDAVYAHLRTNSIHGKNPKVSASVFYDENRKARGGRVLAGITYAAGDSAMVAFQGDVFGNKWINARPAGVAGDVRPWLALLERLLPDEDERRHILDVMAFKRQNPSVKINHAILIIGKPGIGKDSFYYPFLWSIGGKGGRNVKVLDKNDDINAQWGYCFENEVLVLNELRNPEAKDRRAMENTLKPIIAAPPETLTVNRKGLHPYDAVNRILVLAGSNDDVSIILPSDDRRWFVVKSTVAPLDKEDARKLWDWYRNGGLEAVAAWLDARDVSAFNPGARPPMTDAKMTMIEHGMSGGEAYLIELINNCSGEFSNGVVAAPFQQLCDRIQSTAPNSIKVYPAALLHALNEAGWVDLGRIHSRDLHKKHIYAHPEVAKNTSKSEIRRLADQPLGKPRMELVK